MSSSTWKHPIGGVAELERYGVFEGKVRFGTGEAGNAGGCHVENSSWWVGFCSRGCVLVLCSSLAKRV